MLRYRAYRGHAPDLHNLPSAHGCRVERLGLLRARGLYHLAVGLRRAHHCGDQQRLVYRDRRHCWSALHPSARGRRQSHQPDRSGAAPSHERRRDDPYRVRQHLHQRHPLCWRGGHFFHHQRAERGYQLHHAHRPGWRGLLHLPGPRRHRGGLHHGFISGSGWAHELLRHGH